MPFFRPGVVLLVILAYFERLKADVDIDAVVTRIQSSLTKIVNEELGASRLSEEYGKVRYTYDTFNFTSMVSSIDQGGLDLINQLFANISAANITYAQTNCTACNMVEFLNYVNSTFIRAVGSHDVELSLGFDDGRLISPSTGPTEWAQDARLLPWYVNTAAPRPREVVIVAKLPLASTDPGAIKGAVQTVLTSLSPQDKVAVAISLDGDTLMQASSLQGLVDACDINKEILSSFVSNSVGFAGPNFPNISKALSYFSNATSTDKLLLLFTDTIYPNLLQSLTSVPVVVSIYSLNPPQYPSSNPNIFMGALGSKSPGDYYNSTLTSSVSTEPIFTREINSSGVDFLGISQRVSLVGLQGVFHARIPLVRILGTIPGALSNRPSSTFFVADTRTRRLLFHPYLLSSSGNLPLEVVETGLSPAINMSSTLPQSVTRHFLVPLNSTNKGFVAQTVASIANCWPLSLLGRAFAVCVVIAESDSILSTLNATSVDFPGTYSLASRLPVSSNIAQSIPKANQCNYFCTLSTKSNASLQLTQLSSGQQALISTQDSFRSFLNGGVASLVSLAAEIAIGTSASYGWIGQTTSVRSHLATPTGVYLTYPPVQLGSSFQPSYTLWYTAAVAHPGRIVLAPATFSTLSGAVYTVSSAVMAPGSSGQIRAVLASDRSVASLRGMLFAASDGACNDGRSFCFIIDDAGQIVYSPDLLTQGYLSSSKPGPFFMADYGTSFFPEILKVLISIPGFPVKQACTEHLNPSIKLRVFYSFPLYNSSTLVGRGSCTQFKLKLIPGTNAFFGVLTTTCSPLMSCLCSISCVYCDSLQAAACECPCTCARDCTAAQLMMACPPSVSGVASYMGESITPDTGLASCFSPSCSAISSVANCSGTVGCQWCYAQQKCILAGDCCDPNDKSTCCQGQITCLCNSVPVTTVPLLPNDYKTAIIAGVVGGVVGITILIILVVFFIWYQCFLKHDADDGVRDSVFDFNKRTDARNPVNTGVMTPPNVDFKEDVLPEKSKEPAKAESTI